MTSFYAVSALSNMSYIVQEAHLIHEFEDDFYGSELKLVILGYIRPEKNYDSLGMRMLCLISCLYIYINIYKIERIKVCHGSLKVR